MLRVLLITLAPLISLSIFNLGSCFLTTLLSVRFQLDGRSDLLIGGLSSVFFIGYLFGTYFATKFITRVGHIRAYAFYAALITATSMLHGLLLSPVSWLVLRLISGFCTGAIWIVIESWLLTLSTPRTQGQILALYMIFYYIAQSASQQFLVLGDIRSLFPFCLITIFSCLSILPLTFTRVATPQFDEHTPISPLELIKKSPLGTTGCFIGGLILSVILGLLPATAEEMNFDLAGISKIMSILVLGGTLLQYPIGKLSDIINRRLVVFYLALITTIISLILVFIPVSSLKLFILFIFLFGGTTFTIYPLSISYTYDFVDPKTVISTASGLLLIYSIGAVLGPIIAPLFTGLLGAKGIFVFFAVSSGFLTLFTLWRTQVKPPLSVEDQDSFVAMAQPLPVAVTELDPRMPSDGEEHLYEKDQKDDNL